jgi:MarR family transcriptional regulator, lower aerobic nicotinate degradation pathway regulator
VSVDQTWRPLPPVLAGRVTYQLGRAAEASVREADGRLARLGFRTRHYGVLAVLEDQNAPTQRAIADTLAIDRATVVALLDDLSRMGLVQRRRSETDRRANSLRLTPKGRRIVAQAHQLLDECERDFLAALTDSERDRMAAILKRLVQVGGASTP